MYTFPIFQSLFYCSYSLVYTLVCLAMAVHVASWGLRVERRSTTGRQKSFLDWVAAVDF